MWLVVSGVGGALIAGLVAILLDRRAKSGRVETSEAKDLWDTLRGELGRLQVEATALRAEITVARQELAALREDSAVVGARAASVQEALQNCTREVARLRAVIVEMGGDSQ